MRFASTIVSLAAAMCGASAVAQDAGVIRGVVNDRDFESPLSGGEVQVVETGLRVTAGADGGYAIRDLKPGVYTLIFSKEGYQRQVRTDVVVNAGSLTDVDAFLNADFTDMEEFVVQDVKFDSGSDSGLLQLRLDSPALLDSISAELISQAGASDAASALNLVAGATVQDGKYATVRGLPDRYVVTLLNGVRLPTNDEDKRAVQLDLFPTAVIESIQVTKTFTPDQQGDASGGGIDIVLKGIPDENLLSFKTEYKWNSQVKNRSDFLTYDGGSINGWGYDDGRRSIPATIPIQDVPVRPGESLPADATYYDFAGRPLGTTTGDAPAMYKWSVDLGLRHEFEDGPTIGGFVSFFYDRDAAYLDNGVNNNLRVYQGSVNDIGSLSPSLQGQDSTATGIPAPGQDFSTQLYDITEGVESLQWGTLATGGIQWENHEIAASYLYTLTTESKAILAEDTRGREWWYQNVYGRDSGLPLATDAPPGYPGPFQYPGYTDPNTGQVVDQYLPYDVDNPVNSVQNRNAAPYVRSQSLIYTERSISSAQLGGSHVFPFEEEIVAVPDLLTFTGMEFDWSLSYSRARQYQPDKTLFATSWRPGSKSNDQVDYIVNLPPFAVLGFYDYRRFAPEYQLLTGSGGSNAFLGNLQRIYKTIEEDSKQYAGNMKFLYDQWSDDEGYAKIGFFNDSLNREFDQQVFSNYNPGFGSWPSATLPYFNGYTDSVSPPGPYPAIGQFGNLQTETPFQTPPTPQDIWGPDDQNPPEGSGPGFDQKWSDVAVSQIESGVPGSAIFNTWDGGANNPSVDYNGQQQISAFYAMADLPLMTGVNLIGGARFEYTSMRTEVFPESPAGAFWIPPADDDPAGAQLTILKPGDADVSFQQFDVLPSLGVVLELVPGVTFRGSVSQTVARPTFKEITPIIQQEFLGGPIFTGNPNLRMSKVNNYDTRIDWNPAEGSLFSASWFHKTIKDPIEYVKRGTPSFFYTTPSNFPSGKLSGFEVEFRQNFGAFDENLEWLTLGANGTLIDSSVQLPEADIQQFENLYLQNPNIPRFNIENRRMTGAPDYLYNLYATVGLKDTGTDIGVFYTAQGDTLLSGAGVTSKFQFIPSIVAKPVNTLNVTVNQRILDNFFVFFKAKNLLNPTIRNVYQTPDGSGEATFTSYTTGVDLSVGVKASFTF